jgi:hypothetical protein
VYLVDTSALMINNFVVFRLNSMRNSCRSRWKAPYDARSIVYIGTQFRLRHRRAGKAGGSWRLHGPFEGVVIRQDVIKDANKQPYGSFAASKIGKR